MNARSIAAALGGHRSGSGWACHCPAHSDATPSLSISEQGGKILVHCLAGCAQSEVIDKLMRKGLWGRAARRQADESALIETKPRRDPLRAWQASRPAFPGSLVRVYLESRAIVLSEAEAASLRFHPRLFHWPSQDRWPAMVALVKRADGVALTCHQTFIACDGVGKAPIEKPRLLPGGASPAGGGVWFGRLAPGAVAVVAEGIETTLSAMRLIGASAGVAALSTRGVRSLILPEKAQRIMIFADRDLGDQGLEAAWERCRYWRVEGRDVRVVAADNIGEDANDILKRRAS
jgi:putative DNA primase/helicase